MRAFLCAATLALGALVGFGLSSAGCCTCPDDDNPEGFELGEYVITGSGAGHYTSPIADGEFTVTSDSVVVEYSDDADVQWTVTYAVECGNFLVSPCE